MSAYRELLIAAVLVVTIVQHRTSVLDKTACVCSKTSRVEHTKSVHNRPKPAVFVRTALGLSSNQNEVAINSKSGLWRTALFHSNHRVTLSTPRYCQSATCGRLTFCVYPLLFTEKRFYAAVFELSPRPPRAPLPNRHHHFFVYGVSANSIRHVSQSWSPIPGFG